MIIMKKRTSHRNCIISLLFAICITMLQTLTAQQFEWASAGGNLNAGYRASAFDGKGNIIVVGEARVPINLNSGASSLYSSSGDLVAINAFTNPLLVVSYDPSGKINWTYEVKNGGEPIGVVVTGKSQILVLSETGHLYSLSETGQLINTVSCDYKLVWNAHSMQLINDDQLLVLGRKTVDTVAEHPWHEQMLFTYLVCFDQQMHTLWETRVQHETGSSIVPDAVMDVAPTGDIYVGCSILVGARFGKKSIYKATIVDSVYQYNEPYEAFIACYTKNGALKWVQRSGGKSIICSIKATNNAVIIGGTIMNNRQFFGKEADTFQNKKMFLASFSRSGKITWLKTTTAHSVEGITTDQDQNIYAIVESKIAWPNIMLFEGDSLRNVYQALIIASYTKEGQFRWVKHCRMPMSTNEFPQIKTDPCGNIYVSGEMWSIMKSSMNWFDAAFVKGDGYGDGVFIAKLKNTLPIRIAAPGYQKDVCVISPAPWTITAFPNPFATQITIQFRLSYDDPSVSLQAYDLNGRLISTLFSNQPMKAGVYNRVFSSGALANGMYVLVLKGLEAVATERIIKTPSAP